ncbi:MAG TPA: TolC family protein, partial [Campylobacterales bacterium]|nr:TolC family protein [Campylobacterales bacterium]
MKRIFAAAFVAASLSAETLDSFVSKVLQKNPEIASMENTLKASYEEIAISSKLDNPELSIQTLNNDFSNPLARDLSAMQQVTFAITQKIPLTSRLSSREQSKKEAFAAQKNRLEQKKLDIEFEVKTTAYKIAKLKELEQNYKKYLETTRYAAELLQISSSIENSSHSELVRSQVEIASFERKLIEIASQKNIALRKLESFGVAPTEAVEASLDAKVEDISKIDISNSGEAKAIAS